MELVLARTTFTDKTTTGIIGINGIFECYALEDVCREPAPGLWIPSLKVPKQTAIPYGRFEIILNYSDRFKRVMPLLLKVPDFEGVRIHWGNDAEDTEGCPLVGKTRSLDFVGQSRPAFFALFDKLELASKTEKLFISVEKG